MAIGGRRRGPLEHEVRADSAVADRALLASPPERRRVLAGVVAALMLATLTAVLTTGVDTEARFQATLSAYPSVR
jgi:hypothetical protein